MTVSGRSNDVLNRLHKLTSTTLRITLRLSYLNTMRLFLLLLTLFSVPGWSQQPAQQLTQPPIAAKMEPPPANSWTHLSDLLIPGLIGIAGAWIGLLVTSNRQLRLEIARAKHWPS